MITNSISHFLSHISSLTNLSEKCSKLNAFNHGLHDELKNILAFKYQLPICILLLTGAIEKLNEEEIPGCRKREISPGNIEWYPAVAPEDNSGDEDMKNWMSSVTLSLKPEIESGMKKEVENSGEIFNFSNNGRDFLQFTKQNSCLSPNEANFNRNESTNDRSYKKKQRRCWSPELHRLFINALDQLGGAQRATPKYIKDLMHVEDLTNDEIKSHLQKYRLNLRKSPFSAMATEHNGLQTTRNVQFPYYSWNYER